MGVRLRDRWSVATATVDRWMSRNAFQAAAAVAFYTLFSLAPLLIVIITLTGVFLGEEAVRGEISEQIQEVVGGQAAGVVEEAIRRSRLEVSGLLPTLLGVGALLFGATTVVAQLRAALNHIWGVMASPSRSGVVLFVVSRILSLALLIGIGFLLLVSFILGMVLSTLLNYAEELVPLPDAAAAAANVAFSLLVATLLFATIFKVLPDVRVAWADTWRGAFLTGVLFVFGQALISIYLTRTAPGSTYGAAGSLVLLLMWVYYSSLIVLLGAAYMRVGLVRSGRRVEATRTAVSIETEVVEA